MQPESIVELIASGNTRAVEEEWMRVLEAPDLTVTQLRAYDAVLAELSRRERREHAETLAWASIETLSSQYEPEEVLRFAGPFLQAVGESKELRERVAELYQTVYADREGLEALMAEAGIAGGRPVRRALRTLEVCLDITEGDFLVSRDNRQPARVDGLDRASWEFSITARKGSEQLGAVHLADQYRPAAETEFDVRRVFFQDELDRQLADDPASIVTTLCGLHGGELERDALEAELVPKLLAAEEWKKWWSRARTALKRDPRVRIERRAPYTISYHDQDVSLEDAHLAGFAKLHGPQAQYDAVAAYLRACGDRRETPSRDALGKCCETLRRQVDRAGRGSDAQAGFLRILLRWVSEAAELEDAGAGAIEFMRTVDDTEAVFRAIEPESLHKLACDTLVEARPDDWRDRLLALLPTFPMAACDREAARLLEAGTDSAEFEPAVDRIMTAPTLCFGALTWLWNGPSQAERLPQPPLVTILSQMLRALDECKQGEKVDKARARAIVQRARSILSARKFERFILCLDGIKGEMASALRTRIARLDNLGRTVPDGLLNHLSARFPRAEKTEQTPAWLREEILFVTRAGMARRQRKIEHHVNVTMRENAKAIGDAASRGDLSENSEYKFALEERDLLRARLAQMNAEMEQAQVIDPNDVPTDHVGVGSQVVFRRTSDGETYRMAFLGPWESDLDHGRFNYKAPLAQKILGSRIGDVIEFSHGDVSGQYELTEIGNALTDDAALDDNAGSEAQSEAKHAS